MRTKRRQRAEEAAAKTTIKLIFPLVLLHLPGHVRRHPRTGADRDLPDARQLRDETLQVVNVDRGAVLGTRVGAGRRLVVARGRDFSGIGRCRRVRGSCSRRVARSTWSACGSRSTWHFSSGDGIVLGDIPGAGSGLADPVAPGARHALELPAGTLAATGTRPGDRLTWATELSSSAPPSLAATARAMSDDRHPHRNASPRQGRGRAAAVSPRARDPGRHSACPKSSSSICCSRRSTCRGRGPASSWSNHCACPSFVDEQLLTLQQRRFVEVRGTPGPSRGSYIFDLTGDGRVRAREASLRASTSGRRRCRSRSTGTGWRRSPSAGPRHVTQRGATRVPSAGAGDPA